MLIYMYISVFFLYIRSTFSCKYQHIIISIRLRCKGSVVFSILGLVEIFVSFSVMIGLKTHGYECWGEFRPQVHST